MDTRSYNYPLPGIYNKKQEIFCQEDNSALVAFITGSNKMIESGYRIIAAHTDSPGLKIKPAPEIIEEKKYLKLNTEVYGGPILNTWFDRPLALAGRLSYLGENPKPSSRLVNINKPLFIIPNLAIHMKSGEAKLDRQKHLLPLCTIADEGLVKESS